MQQLNTIIQQVTQNIIKRSHNTRTRYLEHMHASYGRKVSREKLSCTNFAHAIAAESKSVQIKLKKLDTPNIGIVTAYNDMLSAHQPYYRYPEQLKQAIMNIGATAQVAGGVPAMCDGITQGQIGMELSLFSRDVIALSTAISLSHNVFDGVICLGICDKIVPGLLIGALQFGYLPTIFIPSGPMPSGISNKEKANTRKLYTEGKITHEELLDSELKSYHAPGTCTFYGTANSNQMLMEMMGLHIPGSAFVTPSSPLRNALNDYAAQQVVQLTSIINNNFTPLCEIITEKTIVNAMIGLIATGGSTNHTLHLPAIARACGILINWDDFAQLSTVIPLLAKIYPNGEADINQFHVSGGVGYIIGELLNHGLLNNDVTTVVGKGLTHYAKTPQLVDNKLQWLESCNTDERIIRSVNNPFTVDGGLKIMQGNLGRAVSKISAIAEQHRYVKAEAKVFATQEAVMEAYQANQLNQDCIVVLCFQGPRANGMPELHGLTPILTSLQEKGYKVGLVTDGRMSGASGKVPNAIHVTPESVNQGNISKIIDGDIIELDLNNSILRVLVDDQELNNRIPKFIDLEKNQHGLGRELFTNFRHVVTISEEGASAIII